MNNAFETLPVPLTVFGGAVTEMAPEDLPEGASPFNQDADYVPGAVFTRGGLRSVYTIANQFVEKLAGLGQSIAGPRAPNEQAWTAPNDVTLNAPPSYANVTLNFGGSSGSPSLVLDQAAQIQNQSQTQTSFSFPALTPLLPNEWVVLLLNDGEEGTTTISPPGFTNLGGVGPTIQALFLGSSTSPITVSGTMLATNYAAALGLFFTNGVPSVVQSRASGTATVQFSSNVTAGNSILVVLNGLGGINNPNTLTVTDDQGNTYTIIEVVTGNLGITNRCCVMAIATNIGGGVKPNVTVNIPGGSTVTISGTVIFELGGLVAPVGGGPSSQILQATDFAFNIPTSETILGVQVEVTGHQNVQTPDAILSANLVLPTGPAPTVLTKQLPGADAQVIIGTPSQNWGAPVTAAIVNNPSFGVQLVAQAAVGNLASFFVSAIKLKVFTSLATPSNFNYIKTYEQTSGQADTLALDAAGTLWDENVTATPGVLNSIYTAINPGSFAKSVTFDDVEYIAFSNLLNGTDMPRQWNGQNLDRISQYGPGAPPSVSTTSSGASVLSITQNPASVLLTGAHDFLLVSAGPAAHGNFGTPATPGNVMTIITRAAFVPPTSGTPPTPIFKPGTNIFISGFPTINGFAVNNDPTGVTNPSFYTITSVGQTIAGQLSYDWITFQVPFTTFFNAPTPGGCSIQSTLATLTASAQVPFLEVGNQFTLSGVTPSGWNNTFVVQATPNAGQFSVTQTSLTGNVATYVFTLISGSLPAVGEFVTVTGTLNGGGIFNVVNAVITAASATQFSVALVGANVNAVGETNANAIISGTIFQFDPAGTVTNPIIGNAGPGGSISTSGVIGVGIRSAVCLFETRNNFITPPSPPVQFNVTITSSAIVCASIPIGPPNVIRRIIAFTGAGGANYFYIPTPQTVTSNGQQVTYTATVINDNITTQATFSFPDSLLLASTAIDIPGNNLFATNELGSSRGLLTYADRLIAWGEQTKIFNLLNLSFDGGIGVLSAQQQQTLPTVSTYPLGWTVDPTNGNGVSLLVSPLFGNSLYIKNATGGPQSLYGMIEQNAALDAFSQPIVLPSTLYSVRVTARSPGLAASGNLVMDLFSPKLNQQFGSSSVPLSSMTTNMQIFTGTLLTAAFSVVPKDLLFRVYLQNVPNNGDCEIDRVEPFITTQPSFSTQFHASYAGNQEAFDLNTGLFGPDQNQQPINGGAVLFDSLYALKEKSIYSTSDNGVTEPGQWRFREVSNKVGTLGIHAYDFGEGWMLTAARPGLHFFEGGEPIKISQEIQSVWDLINWNAAQTVWVRNDQQLKRITVGAPIPTPNPFMPEFPVNTNPTSPNVILMCSYRELNTGMAMANTGPIKSTFSGRLLSPEPARKWSFWNIPCPYADFISRGNEDWPEFFCNGIGNSKIYQVQGSQLSDDGAAINSFWISYGFVKPEMADAKGLGLFRMELAYLTMLMTGAGNVNTLVYPETVQNNPASLTNPLPYILDAIPLQAFSQGDVELPVNIKGNRFFIRVGTNQVGSSFRCSKMVAALMQDAWSPIRGTNVGAS